LLKSKCSDNSDDRGISAIKFGWFEGVFIRTSVNLLGVMLFMRMGWMAGQAGICKADRNQSLISLIQPNF
jgi:hypothetical protein